MDPDLAYLLGAAGDASAIYNPKKNEYYIEYWQKVPEWLKKSVKRRVAKIYKKKRLKVRSKKGGLFMLRFYSKEAYHRFKEFERNPAQILKEPINVQLHYLRGFFDAEGSAPRFRSRCHRIVIYQKDRKYLRILLKILENVGIPTGKLTNSRDVGILPVNRRENVAKFARIVKPEHPAKKIALQLMLSAC